MVRYPQMRNELLETLRVLAERDYQQRAWVEHCYPASIQYDSFDEAVHFLYDDTLLAKNPNAAIGQILKNSEEAHSIEAVYNALDRVFDDLGRSQADEAYINAAQWETVIAAASSALQVMKATPQPLIAE